MLTALEIVLGIDNILSISILVGRLPPEQRDIAREPGLGFAMLSRSMLVAAKPIGPVNPLHCPATKGL